MDHPEHRSRAGVPPLRSSGIPILVFRGIVCLVLLALVRASSAPGDDGPGPWPVRARPAITSSFGEYRPGHLHSGIDLKSWGRVGYPVVAVGNGHISRARTSPWGYGKAVYLKLEDGSTAVYAHLLGFTPEVEEAIYMAQLEAGRYSVDLHFEEGRFQVSVGDTIGWSGRSGAEAPHLHFELRGPDGTPLNPERLGFSLPDSLPPLFSRAAVIPFGPRSNVAGARSPLVLDLVWDGGRGSYICRDTVQVLGDIGFSVQVWDRENGVDNLRSPYRIELSIDGVPLVSRTCDFFPFTEAHLVDLDFNVELRRRGFGIFHNLFISPGNNLPFYERHGGSNGVVSFGPAPGGGLHRVEIRAYDVAGNSSSCELFILADSPPSLSDVLAEELPSGAVRISAAAFDGDGDVRRISVSTSGDLGRSWRPCFEGDGGDVTFELTLPGEVPSGVLAFKVIAFDGEGVASLPAFGILPTGTPRDPAVPPEMAIREVVHPDFVEVFLEPAPVLSGPLRVAASGPWGERALPVERIDLRLYRATFVPPPECFGWVRFTAEGTDIYGRKVSCIRELGYGLISPELGGEISLDSVMVSFDRGGVYDSLYIGISVCETEGSDELRPVGSAYRLLPDGAPLSKGGTISIIYPDTVSRAGRLAVYALGEDGSWKFAGSSVNPASGTVSALLRQLSTFALFLDLSPPEIWDLSPADGEVVGGRPVISAKVRDSGVGIGSDTDVAIIVDGKPVIAEYDPFIDTVSFRPREALSPGEHSVEVVARDRVGNSSVSESTFTVR